MNHLLFALPLGYAMTYSDYRVIKIAILVLVFVWGVKATLTVQEEAALSQILDNFPNLAKVPVLNRYDTDDPAADNGAPWTFNFTGVCTRGKGWDIYGVHCSSEGHIDAIKQSIVWGQSLDLGFGNLTGLAYLTNYTKTDAFPADSFEDGIASLPSLRHVWIDSGRSVPAQLQSNNSLQTLAATIDLANFPFEGMPNLSKLTLFGANGNPFDFVQNLSSHLQELYIEDPFFTPLTLSQLVDFPALISFGCKRCAISDNLVVPDAHSLENFYLRESTFQSITFNASKLKSIELSVSNANEIKRGLTFNTNVLESLIITGPIALSYPIDLPHSLTFLALENVTNVNFWTSFPSMEHMTSLRELQLISSSELSNEVLDNMLCSLPNDVLRAFYLNRCPSEVTIPPCLKTQQTELLEVRIFAHRLNRTQLLPDPFPHSLTRFELTTDGYGVAGGMDFEKWVSYFPNMRKFGMTYISLRVPFSPKLLEWRDLEELSLPYNGLTGTLPYDLLLHWPRLTKLVLSYNFLSGNVPWQGMQTIYMMLLEGNQFTAWPSILGNAPLLRVVNLADNRLSIIPDDASFERMPTLGALSLKNNAEIRGPIPKFWAQIPSIANHINLANCSFEGQVPSPIHNPHLRHLEFSQNQLCGTLPDFEEANLYSLLAAQNQFTGAFPDSWVEDLAILYHLEIQENALEGPFGTSFPVNIHNFGSAALNLNFSSNPISGSILSLNRFTGSIDVTNTSIDICSAEIGAVNDATSCFVDIEEACACVAFWGNCANTTTCGLTKREIESSSRYTRSTAIQHTHSSIEGSEADMKGPQCLQPRPRGPYVIDDLTCPPPRPNGFTCVEGTWVSLGSQEQPTIVVPPSSIVVIQGNLTVTSPDGITFQGTGSTITVLGCVFFHSEGGVTIELTEEELELLAKEGKLEKTLLQSLNGNNCEGSTDLSQVAISAKKPSKKGCRKVKAQNAEKGRDSLHVLLKINNSTCNMIIIIPSVLGGVIIITAVATIIGLVLRNQKMSRNTA